MPIFNQLLAECLSAVRYLYDFALGNLDAEQCFAAPHPLHTSESAVFCPLEHLLECWPTVIACFVVWMMCVCAEVHCSLTS